MNILPPPFRLSLSKSRATPPFGLSLSKPWHRARQPFDKLRTIGTRTPFGLSLSKPKPLRASALRQAQGERECAMTVPA